MGAVPVGHNFIIDLKDVPCEEEDMGETNAYHFSLKDADGYPSLTEEDKNILDIIIDRHERTVYAANPVIMKLSSSLFDPNVKIFKYIS